MATSLDSVLVTWRFGEKGPVVIGSARIAGSTFKGRISSGDLTEEEITDMIAALMELTEILKRQHAARKK